MKYLHDDRLAELTTILTENMLGGVVSHRVLHGRIEAYTMKRGTNDKRYAFKLGEKYVASLEQHLREADTAVQQLSRKRSQSAGMFEETTITSPGWSSSGSNSNTHMADTNNARDGDAEQQQQQLSNEPLTKVGRRSRASSFDATRSLLMKENAAALSRHQSAPVASNTTAPTLGVVPSALGDFAEQGTRRLMTDLILTLNMSFPDFDFAAVKPTDFAKVPVNAAMVRITELLSDVALRKESFLTDLWSSLDQVIHLSECDVYSYQPLSSDDQDDDPMAFLTETLTQHTPVDNSNDPSRMMLRDQDSDDSLGNQSNSNINTTIWTFNYFFVNKTIKRIVLFTCVESMRNHEPGDMRDEDDDENNGAFCPAVSDLTTELDFDLDPASTPAGGFPISSI